MTSSSPPLPVDLFIHDLTLVTALTVCLWSTADVWHRLQKVFKTSQSSHRQTQCLSDSALADRIIFCLKWMRCDAADCDGWSTASGLKGCAECEVSALFSLAVCPTVGSLPPEGRRSSAAGPSSWCIPLPIWDQERMRREDFRIVLEENTSSRSSRSSESPPGVQTEQSLRL